MACQVVPEAHVFSGLHGTSPGVCEPVVSRLKIFLYHHRAELVDLLVCLDAGVPGGKDFIQSGLA
jgi:hypothetical protein